MGSETKPTICSLCDETIGKLGIFIKDPKEPNSKYYEAFCSAQCAVKRLWDLVLTNDY